MEIYLVLALFVYLVNVVPAFMPPTWIILAFFTLKYHLILGPVVAIGAVFATCGRISLYYLSKQYFIYFLSSSSKENMDYLGNFFNSNKKVSVPLIITYAFLPIPSNQVYITAGLARFDIKLLAASFLIGRVISYTFWVALTRKVADDFISIFSGEYSNISKIVVQLIGFSLIFLIAKIPWRKLLKKYNK